MSFIKSILRVLRSVVLLVLLICMVVFMVDNRQIITIGMHPLPFEIETRVFVMMLTCFVLGLASGVAVCSPKIIRGFFRKIIDRQKIKKLEKQVQG